VSDSFLPILDHFQRFVAIFFEILAFNSECLPRRMLTRVHSPGIGDIVAGSIGAAARIGSAAGAQGKVKKILKRANNDTFGPVGLLAV
jgi:hypothetical protein